MIFFIIYLLISIVRATQITCRGHDACKNYKWSGQYDISCGGANSERTCKGTTLKCEKDETCSIKTTGSGHDAYQQSTVNAKEALSFTLTCAASGQRDCQDITIWCPQQKDSTCDCIGCGNQVTMKCVKDKGCKNTGAAAIEYVQPDNTENILWAKDTSHTGKRPDCPQIPINPEGQNYIWNTLEMCFSKCINEPTGKCNMVSRYGETTKTPAENYHCRFYACQDPTKFDWIIQEQWGNGASTSNTYALSIRHYIEEPPCVVNETRYINKTRWINTSEYFYDDNMIQNICKEGRYNYYKTSNNEAWTTKSWNLGCEQYESGYITLDTCKIQCQCNRAPDIFKTHQKYKQCSKTQASTNYLPCRQNACSGGSCCSRSSTICKNACKAYHAIKFDGKKITQVDTPKYINKTRYIDKERWTNKTRYIDKERWTNKTRYIDKERWTNKTRYVNETRYIDKERIKPSVDQSSVDQTTLTNSTDSMDNSQNGPITTVSAQEKWNSPITVREGVLFSTIGILLFLFIWREITRCCGQKTHTHVPRTTVPINSPHLIEMAPVATPVTQPVPTGVFSKKTPDV